MRRTVLLVFLMLFSATALPAIWISEVEPNDTFDTATHVEPGHGYYGILGNGSPDDVDFLSFDVNEGDTIRVTLINLCSWDSPMDIYDADRNLIHSMQGPPGITSYTYVVRKTGLNWLRLHSFFCDYDYSFDLEFVTESTLPVELSSFSASVTTSNFVSIEWITQTETDMLGYNILRSETAAVESALDLSYNIIPAQNQSTETNYQYIDEEVEAGKTYWFWLESIEATGESNLHGPVSATLAADDDDSPDGAWMTALENNVPNPFNPSTSIIYTLSQDSAVEVAVYNSRGQLVRLLYDDKPKGRHSIVWDGRDNTGSVCASGVYYFHLNACCVQDFRKGVLLK